MTTLFSAQASAHATQAGDAIDMERRSAVTLAAQLIAEGRPGRAQYELARSVTRQARIAGIAAAQVPACPCGGRCRS